MKEIKSRLQGIFPDIIINKLVDYLIQAIITPAILLDDVSNSDFDSEEEEPTEFELPELSPNSCNYLHYQVYPFEQCCEKSKRHFGVEDRDCHRVVGTEGENYSESVNFINHSDFPDLKEFTFWYSYRWNDKILYIGDGKEAWVYVITDQSNHILSAFHDPLYDYQLGDGETFVDIWNKRDLVVSNWGDVSSLVIIKDMMHK